MSHKCKFKVGDIIVFNSEFEDRMDIPRGVISMKITAIRPHSKEYTYVFLTHYRAENQGAKTEQLFTLLESIAHKQISPNSIWKELNT